MSTLPMARPCEEAEGIMKTPMPGSEEDEALFKEWAKEQELPTDMKMGCFTYHITAWAWNAWVARGAKEYE